MPFNTPKSIRKRGRLEKVICPQCGKYVLKGSLSRHISHTDGHSVAFFQSNVSVNSVINNKAGTSENFMNFSDGGFLGNDDSQVINFMESLRENPQLERNVGRLEQFPNAGTTTPIQISSV